MRFTEIKRETKETQIQLQLNLDGSGVFQGSSGIGFFDHMLTAFAVHGGFDLTLLMQGDLNVDGHHSVEDVGIVLGQAFAQVLDKSQIQRFGSFYVPMDEALAFCALDVSGRPYLVFDAAFSNPSVGALDCCLVEEFSALLPCTVVLRCISVWNTAAMTILKIEAIFKAVAHALQQAAALREGNILSTKGVLE